MKKKLQDTESQLDIIQEQILDKIETILKVEKDAKYAVAQLEKMTQEVKEIKESEEVLTKQLEKAENKLRTEQTKNDKLSEITRGLQAVHEKMKVGF